MASARTVINDRAIDALRRLPEWEAALEREARPLVAAAQNAAPRRTGGGAASIRAEAVLDGDSWTAAVGWDQLHYYMIFHELGTRTLPARPFLVPAVKGAAQ